MWLVLVKGEHKAVIGWLTGKGVSRPSSGPIALRTSVAAQEAVKHGDQDGDQTGNEPLSPAAASKRLS